MPSDPHTYRVSLTDRQMGLVMAALETHTRIQSGQFDIAFKNALGYRETNIGQESLRLALDALKVAMWPELATNSYRGVGDKDFPEIGECFTIRSAMRYRYSMDQLEPGEKPGHTVNFSPVSYTHLTLPTTPYV